jgi:SAM-dependent methyltransferase
MVAEHSTDKAWKKFGDDDPYYGVISLEKFHKDNLNDEALGEFFESGRSHIEFVLKEVRDHLCPEFKPTRSLDFGCGVGRCTFPLAAYGDVVGIDVSTSMLDEAKTWREKFALRNVDFVLSNGDLSGLEGEFDFVHSFIVFQHIREDRGLGIIDGLTQRMRPGGVGAIQVLYHRDVSPVKRLVGVLRRHVPLVHGICNLVVGKPFGEPLMEKNSYAMTKLLLRLDRAGCGRVHVVFQGAPDFRSAVVFFQKAAADVPFDEFYLGGES